MIKQHYTGSSRRAVNLIWNAAGSYDFDPPFLAFFPNGDADGYFNMIIGFAHKWLNLDRIDAFFESLGTSNTAAEASSVLWLGIENCVYGKELPDRPILESLRRQRAKDFFTYAASLSRQQMMLQSTKVFDQDSARWSKVLKKKAVLSPAAQKLARELEFAEDLDTNALLEKMAYISRTFFHLKPGKANAGTTSIAVRGLAASIARAVMKREIRNTDLLILRKGSGQGDRKGAVHLEHVFGQQHTSGDPEKDRAYIQECFGPCMYSDREMRILENSLCRDVDSSCRLWIVRTDKRVPQSRSSFEADDRHDGKGGNSSQTKRNLKFYRDNILKIKENIRDLTAQTDTIFSTYLHYLPKRSRHGKIHAEEAWRLPVLSDPNVFLSDSDAAEFSLTVDLLLDASQSRMNIQEMIASQALIIARSFEACGIPVRVTAFRSLRGYTVLERLKEYGDKKGDGTFHYYAGGWNRDGLCLKTMNYLMEEEKEKNASRRILLVLTDANPNDSMQIPADSDHILPREYEGDVAVRDAAESVKLLRKSGIRTSAIYFGPNTHLDNVHMIYGQDYVRIRSLSQFADAVSQLLKRSLEQCGPA
ncbi:MAG: hypothetical protein U0L49_03910 [Eubacterium sp.]|nr:hypothetical protein [Eubacterium sp.]